jgi:hypothetical protein
MKRSSLSAKSSKSEKKVKTISTPKSRSPVKKNESKDKVFRLTDIIEPIKPK